MAKSKKAATVLEMLNKGMSTKEIINKFAVSPGYVWKLKKEMAHKTEENDDNVVRPRVVAPHKVMRVTKKQAEAIKELTFQRADSTSVDAILDKRAEQYGSFYDLASLAQGLKNVMMTHLQKHNKTLVVDQQEALEFILSKIARITNGDADYADSWVDIAGYAKLVADRLQGNVR